MDFLSKVSQKEWRFVFLLSLALVTVTVLPLVVGYLMQNENYRFVGFVNPHEDMNSYFSWMKQAEKGYIFFEEKFTTEKDWLRNVFLPYFLIEGLLSRYSGIPIVIIHQITRVICAMLLLLTSYIFCAYFIEDVLKRRVAFLLICFSSGFGFYFSCLYHFFRFKLPPIFMVPCDQVHPGAITFWGIDWFAHAELSITIMLWVFLLMIESYRKKQLVLVVYAGLLTVMSIFIHPIRIVSIFFVLGLYSLYLGYKDKKIRARVILNYLVLSLISLAGIIPMLITVIKNPTTQVYFIHAILYNILGYLLGLGLVGFVAIWAIFKIIQEHREEYYFLVAWAVGTLVLFHLPIGFRMRLVEGLHIDLSILCALGLFWLAERWGWFKTGVLKKAGIVFITLFIIVSSPSNLMHIIVDFRTATQVKYPYFLSKDLENVFVWMDKHLPEDGIVLASREVGNFIPGRTGLKTYIGHVGETRYKRRKLQELNRFMSRETDDQFRLSLLKNNEIDYLFISDFERKLGDFNPDTAKFLKKIYRSGSVILYRVNLS